MTYRIEKKLTPNRSKTNVPKELIVLHSTEGNYEGALAWMLNPKSRVSAHFLVPKDPKKKPIVQLAEITDKTWHTGKAIWNGRRNVNSLSIGIEQEHFDKKESWKDEQVKACAWLCGWIEKQLGKKLEITSHAEVAIPKGRKIDPYEYPWEKFYTYLESFRGEEEKKKEKEDTGKFMVYVNNEKVGCFLKESSLYVSLRDIERALRNTKEQYRILASLVQSGRKFKLFVRGR